MTTILVVDDTRANRDLLECILDLADYDVVTAASAAAGLAASAEHRPDLVLVDLTMPDTDGFGFLTALRASEPDLPVVAMSAGVMLTRHEILGMGFAAFVSLPLDQDVLFQVLRAALPFATVAPATNRRAGRALRRSQAS